MVCTEAKPCLFDLIADPQERRNLAEEHPDIVAHIKSAMYGLNYPPYTGNAMLPEEKEKYECLPAKTAQKQWWGGYAGPCCRPKNSTATHQIV